MERLEPESPSYVKPIREIQQSSLSNQWVMNYIKDKGGRVSLKEIEDAFTKYTIEGFHDIIVDMADGKMLTIGLDTDSFEEYVQMEGMSNELL